MIRVVDSLLSDKEEEDANGHTKEMKRRIGRGGGERLLLPDRYTRAVSAERLWGVVDPAGHSYDGDT